MFWILSVVMALLVVLMLARALWRGAAEGAEMAADYDLRVYRDQLAEIERDVARGVVPAEDAERVRTEISRRILKADAERNTALQAGDPRMVALVGICAVLLGGSVWLYAQLGQPGYGDMALADRIAFAEDARENRPSQQSAVDSLAGSRPAPELPAEYADLLERLRTTVANRPDDTQGLRLLAETEANIGNFPAAAQAQEGLIRALGDQVETQQIGDYAELMVLAAGGYVSPEAEVALREVLSRDREDGRARYFIGLMLMQTGRPDQAFRIWDGLLRRGPEDAPWIEPVKAQIMRAAGLAGVDYTMPAIGQGNRPGPSTEDIEAASDMTAEDRMEMIGGMVAGLSDRLATEGGPPRDWARLITSLGVLGQTQQARAVFDNAMEVFAGDAGALDMIRNAGSQAGVAE